MISKKTIELQKKAKRLIPGWTQLLSKRPDQFSEGVWPGYFSKAKGAYIWDLDKNKYLDMSISGIGANVLGYADPDVSDAVISAVKNGSSSSLNSYEEVDLADTLCDIHPWADAARFSRSGGESMSIAVRIARAHTKKSKIAFCGYHGWHDWYLAANLQDSSKLNDHLLSGLEPLGVPKELAGTAVPFLFNNCEELEKIAKQNTNQLAAIVLEPIRNEEPTEEFKKMLLHVKQLTGAVIIIDEISAGFRLNAGGAHLNLGYEPDMAVFSKALGNGHPVGAIIGKSSVMNIAKDCFISSTYWTERVGYVAALATIRKYIECDVSTHLVKIGDSVQSCWKNAAKKTNLNISVSGISPLSHFSFNYEDPLLIKAYFVQLMLERGILSSNLFYSMYSHDMTMIDTYSKAVEESFKLIKQGIDNKNLESLIKGKRSNSGFIRLN